MTQKSPTIDPYRPHPLVGSIGKRSSKSLEKRWLPVLLLGNLLSVVVMSPGDLRHDRTTWVTYAEKKWPMFMSRGRRYLMSFLPSNFFSHFSRRGVSVPCSALESRIFR